MESNNKPLIYLHSLTLTASLSKPKASTQPLDTPELEVLSDHSPSSTKALSPNELFAFSVTNIIDDIDFGLGDVKQTLVSKGFPSIVGFEGLAQLLLVEVGSDGENFVPKKLDPVLGIW